MHGQMNVKIVMAILHNIYILPVILYYQLWYDRLKWQNGSCSTIHLLCPHYISMLAVHICYLVSDSVIVIEVLTVVMLKIQGILDF
jgi:hypothetical protein